mgnify:CR=1 FL=1
MIITQLLNSNVFIDGAGTVRINSVHDRSKKPVLNGLLCFYGNIPCVWKKIISRNGQTYPDRFFRRRDRNLYHDVHTAFPYKQPAVNDTYARNRGTERLPDNYRFLIWRGFAYGESSGDNGQ